MQAPEPQTITATEEAPEAAPANPENPAEKTYFNSPFTGELHPITDAPDEAFAGKMTGDGFFVYPTENTVYAPADGEVTFVFDTKHAIGMTTADGVANTSLHIGIDTVKLNGQGFTVFVEDGQEVKQGRQASWNSTTNSSSRTPLSGRLPVHLHRHGRHSRSPYRDDRPGQSLRQSRLVLIRDRKHSLRLS